MTRAACRACSTSGRPGNKGGPERIRSLLLVKFVTNARGETSSQLQD
ncbi:MAG: hypothetical protein LBT86_10125 [Deltaproteobacteria bacterium]|nr:hypothetical protein [Deltaproteobacteria bacterium]